MSLKNQFYFDKKENFLKNTFFLLLIIGIVGIFLRLNYVPLDIPFLSDAFLYFSYANDFSILDKFPTGYNFTNNGWPTILGLIFNFFPNQEIIDLMNIQRITSIIISTLTIFPLYYFLRNFFPKYISLLGTCLFLFEPRIIINSILGITDPVYIILITAALAIFFHKNKNYVYFSFICIAFAILIRYEAIIWFGIFSTIFFISNRKKINYKLFLKYGIILAVTTLIIFPMTLVRVETMGSDQITPVLEGSIRSIDVLTDDENKTFSTILFFGNGAFQIVKYLAWIMIPYLLIFVPIGFFFAIKKKSSHTKYLIFSIIMVCSTSILYAYSRGIEETRYLYPLYPIFIVFGLSLVEKIFDKTKHKKMITTIIIGGIIISSIVFLEEKSIDIEHEKEAYEIFKDVYSITGVTNKFDHESGYLTVMPIMEEKNPTIIANFEHNTRNIYFDKTLDLREFIEKNSKDGLKYIIIDDGNDRPSFFYDLMRDENNFKYLEKVYDSKELEYKYHVKVFKINFELFEK